MPVIAVKVLPNASRTACLGLVDGAYRIRLQERAENGKANKALIAFLAKQLGIGKKDVILLSGEKARQKRLQIDGLDDETVAARLSTNPF